MLAELVERFVRLRYCCLAVDDDEVTRLCKDCYALFVNDYFIHAPLKYTLFVLPRGLYNGDDFVLMLSLSGFAFGLIFEKSY